MRGMEGAKWKPKSIRSDDSVQNNDILARSLLDVNTICCRKITKGLHVKQFVEKRSSCHELERSKLEGL